jgi:hypothetical protein
MAIILDSGGNLLGLSESCDPDGSSSRTSPDSIDPDSERSSPTWPRSGSMRNGTVCPHGPLVPLSKDTDFLFLPTPTASDHKSQGKIETRRGTLSNYIEMIPAWIPCECCEGFMCSIHGNHVHECKCPEIGEWSVDPYGPARHGRLNPPFVEWLMGFPPGWTDCEHSEMLLFHK